MTLLGAALVVATWAAMIAAFLALGLPWVRAAHRDRALTLRLALWAGLLAWVVASTALTLVGPLQSSTAAWLLLMVIALSAVVAFVRRPRWVTTAEQRPPLLLLLACLAVIGYLAVAVLGPVTNYDTGLYHLGAIRYAFDEGVIPGLANLFDPYGYGNAFFPFAASLGAGPWGGEGYRLANGLIVAALLVDLLLRWRAGRRSPGDLIALAGTVAAIVPFVAMADYWIASPTSDPAVFVLSIVAFAALSDALWAEARSVSRANAAIAVIALLIAASMRPLMWLPLLVVAAILILRGRWAIITPARSTSALVLAAIALIGVQTLRDRILSGWLQYPLKLFRFDVPWAAADPTDSQLATLASARDPIGREAARSGYGWVGAWLERIPSQWEPFELLALLLAFVVCLVLVARTSRSFPARLVVLSMLPAAVTVVAWFLVTPPSFRFAWGPVFALGFIPLGWALWSLDSPLRGRLTSIAAAVVVALVAVCAIWRLDPPVGGVADVAIGPWHLKVPVTPVPQAPTKLEVTSNGVPVRVPTASDQCWATYPMCSPAAEPAMGWLNRPTFTDGLTSGLLD